MRSALLLVLLVVARERRWACVAWLVWGELPILLMVVVRKEEEDDEAEEERRRCMLDGATGGRKANVGTMLTMTTTTQSEWKATRKERLAIHNPPEGMQAPALTNSNSNL